MVLLILRQLVAGKKNKNMAKKFISDEEMMGLEKAGKASVPKRFISDEEMNKRMSSTPAPVEEKKGGLFSRYNAWAQGDNWLKSFAKGSAKQTLKTVQGTGQTALRGLEMAADVIPFVDVKKGQFGSQETFSEDPMALEAQGGWEMAGGIYAKVMEYAGTAAAFKNVYTTINTVSNGIKAGKGTTFIQGFTRAWGKAGVEGLKTYAQERIGGGTDEESKGRAKVAGWAAGLTSGILGSIGEIYRGYNMPRKTIEKILTDNQQSLKSGMKREGYEYMRKTNPTKFREMVEAEMITVDPKTGEIGLNNRLSVEASNRGVVSTPENMKNTFVDRLASLELEKRQLLGLDVTGKNIIDKTMKPIVIPKGESKIYKNILQTVVDKSDDLGIHTDNVIKAQDLIDKIDTGFRGKGTLHPSDAYDLRIMIDRMINNRSFTASGKSILTTMRQSQLVAARTSLKKILDVASPEFERNMKDYHFYLDAFDALARWMKSQQGQHTTGIFDLMRKGTVPLLTSISQKVYRPGTPGIGAQTLRGVAGSQAGEMFRQR
jgi:hypothetical protein